MKSKVLVIDDDVFCLNLAEEYFIDQGFSVTSSLRATCTMIEQGTEACPLNTCVYDIIFSDNNMPGMKGLELFEYQRQRGCKIPIQRKALISGDLSGNDQKMAKSIGYKVFHKPTSLDLIDAWVDEVMDNNI